MPSKPPICAADGGFAALQCIFPLSFTGPKMPRFPGF
jgi:hypothetical protein